MKLHEVFSLERPYPNYGTFQIFLDKPHPYGMHRYICNAYGVQKNGKNHTNSFKKNCELLLFVALLFQTVVPVCTCTALFFLPETMMCFFSYLIFYCKFLFGYLLLLKQGVLILLIFIQDRQRG
jgi:hypothetical protein